MESREAQREKLNIFITLATTALQHRRPDEPSRLERHSDDILRILQHIATLITTGAPKNYRKPKNDPNASRVVAVTANVQGNSIRTLLVTANTRLGVSPGSGVETDIKPLGGKKAGKDVLRDWDEQECVLCSPHIVILSHGHILNLCQSFSALAPTTIIYLLS